MRAALDEVAEREKRYIWLTNYASGLCMPRDRRDGRPRAPRHDAERLDVRHPLPRHQHVPDLRRPEVQPDDQLLRGDHHQHGRGQLPHHERRLRERAPPSSRASSSTSSSATRPASPRASWASATPSRWTRTSRTAFSSSSPRPRWRARSSRSIRSSTCRPRNSCRATSSRDSPWTRCSTLCRRRLIRASTSSAC